jgi:3-(3-hydroxy-phenyl)propionate hydroxylase
MTTSKLDRVLVAGAGPVGLTTALLLAQRGIPVTVVESNPIIQKDYRAAGFHPSTLDLLEESGATQALLDMGLVCPVMQYRDQKEGKIVEFDFSLLKNDTRHPFRVQCEQFKLAEWLAKTIDKMPNSEVRFSHKLVGFTQDESGVNATIESPAGKRVIRADYLIGADGGRSTVRKSMNIAYDGFTYPERILVMGTTVEFRDVIDDLCLINYVASPGKSCFIFRLPDLWKIGVPVPDDVTDDVAKSDDYIQRELQAIVARSEPYDIHFRAIFRVHQRVAATYRLGRVLLVGDAAHVNHPAGGMGLNGGLHDAVNLTDRLARVWHGKADEREFDGYEVQRRPEAIDAIQKYTDRNFKNLQESDTDKRARILDGWRRMSVEPALAYQHLLETSMIDSLRASLAR